MEKGSHTRTLREVVRILLISLMCTALAAALAVHWRQRGPSPVGAVLWQQQQQQQQHQQEQQQHLPQQPQQQQRQQQPHVPRHAFPITGTASDPPAPVLAADFGGLRHYSLPCELPAAGGGDGSVQGVLHIYLKALRWPQPAGGEATHHLRLKGFAAFEFFTPPSSWKRRYTFSNIPEVALTTRLMLREPPVLHKLPREWKWRRRIPLEFVFNPCEAGSAQPGFDYQACVEEKRRTPHTFYGLGDISLDLGPEPPLNLELGVDGWPRWLALAPQLTGAMAAPPGRPIGDSAAPPVYLAMLYIRKLPASHAAQLLAWSDEYHAPLGVNGTLMYVRPHDAVALAAEPLIRKLTASGRLTLMQWDPDVTRDDWYDWDSQIVETHSALSLWGEGVLVLVQDLDEFLVPAKPGDTLRALLHPGSGCLAQHSRECRYIARSNIFPARRVHEPEMWRQARRSPLRRYTLSAQQNNPKPLVDPSATMPIDIHTSTVCVGADTVLTVGNDTSADGDLRSACADRQPCAWVPRSCVWLAHVSNMFFRRRRTPEDAVPIGPADWLWMLQRNGSVESGGGSGGGG